jgi:hypothetical protein
VAWISIYDQVRDHPKLRTLARTLRVNRHEAMGILVFLWIWGLTNADRDGNLNGSDANDIAEGVMFRGEPQRLVDGLIASGWMNITNGHYSIHDWDDWQAEWFKYLDKKQYNTVRMRELRHPIGQQTDNSIPHSAVNSCTTVVATCDPYHTIPDHTLPNHTNNEKKEVIHRAFVKPTLEEVTEYCRERKNKVDPMKWFDHYTSNGWMVGKTKMVSWKAAVRTWEHSTDNKPIPKRDNFEQRVYTDEHFDRIANASLKQGEHHG